MLRIHHLLCIAGFRDRGYSPGFIRNMRRIVDRIKGDPELPVKLVDGCDAICEACPHRRAKVCARPGSAGDARRRDRRIANALGLAPGSVMAVAEVYERIAATISKETGIEAFCGECEWRRYPFCEEGLSAVRKRQFLQGPGAPRLERD